MNRIGKYGQLQAWGRELDDTSNKHWYVSQTWAVYPGSEINRERMLELLKAASVDYLSWGWC
jgi:hypothetical protein